MAACLANADLPVEHEALEAAIGEAGWAPSYEVVNDTFALLRAGLDSVTRRGGGLRRRDQLHRRAGGRQDGAVRRGRAHLRRLGRRRPPVAGGDVVGGPGRGRPRPRHRAAHRAPRALRALVDGRPDRGRPPRRPARGAVHGADARALLRRRGRRPRSPSTSCGARPTRSSRWRPPRSAASTPSRSRSTWSSAAACSPPATALLIDEITRLLADQAPLAVARVVEAPPIVGAALLALDRIGAGDGAQLLLRESFYPVGR